MKRTKYHDIIASMQRINLFKSILLLTLLGFIWGSGYTIAKFAMSHGVSPLGYAFWQSFGPALLLSLFNSLRDNKALTNRSYWPYFILCGLMGIAIPNTNMYFIAPHIPSGLLAVLVNTVPLFIYPMAILSGQESLDKWRFLAIILGVMGILLIIGVSTFTTYTHWMVLALISPIGFASCSIYIARKQPKTMSNLQAASGMLLAASLLLLPLLIQQEAFYPLTWPFSLVQQAVILEMILSTVGYLLFFKLICLAGPVFYSLTGGMVALTGLFWGYLLFDEIPGSQQSLAIVLILSALFLLSWRQSQHMQGA